MAMYVYSTRGEPIGFVMETFIHTMEGQAVGRIMGSRVHRLDGSYVGEFFKDMVVAKPDGRPRNVFPIASPPHRVPPPKSFNKRVVLHNGYEDTFHLLTVAVDEPEYQEAAE
ncbi:MAG: hypothetical protein JWL74_1947 [Alphaproteobacteria bacterium]|jgi:hypothetical protein|nr:hypothetical protein [Alphaproteobacteria bacterium]